MNSSEAFRRPVSRAPAIDRQSMVMAFGLHAGILVFVILLGVVMNAGSTPVITGGGSMVSVEMILLDPAPGAEGTTAQVAVEEVRVEETLEILEVFEETVEAEESQEEIQEEVQPVEVEPSEVEPSEVTPTETQQQAESQAAGGFIGVGGSGEAGAGAPGPASYEGRVFAAIRRNFVTSMEPVETYQIHFTVNTDGTHRYEVVRRSGNAAFDRAVENALETANIPPMPPGRTTPVRLSIEFLGPE